MRPFLPRTLLGCFTFALFALNTLFWGGMIYLVVPAKILVPLTAWRAGCTRLMTRMAEAWIDWNNRGLAATQRIRWDIQGEVGLAGGESYLVSCNHQSWVDIVALQKAFNRRIPFLKFFLKKNLIWVPVLGGAWWALDFPFMRRYSAGYLAAHPEKRRTDLDATRRACRRFGASPVSVLNFMEGTRFTRAKHSAQGSPYEHLLKPKAGGAAFVLGAMGGRIKTLLDVTIVYPDGAASFWDLFTARIGRVVVRVRERAIPEEFLGGGSYLDDQALRGRFQAWVREIWAEKDSEIGAILAEKATLRP